MPSHPLRVAATISALALASCGIKPSETEFAAAAGRIFEQIDDADYEGIYRDSSDVFTESPESLESFKAYMALNAEKLGRCQPPRPRKASVTIVTHYGIVTYQDFLRDCASGRADIQVSTIQRQGRPKLIGLHFYGDALSAPEPLNPKPDWITDADLALLENLGVDPRADLEARAEYHWGWRTTKAFTAGEYRCPGGSTIDIARSIKVIRAPDGMACETASQARTEILKLSADGSTKPLGD